MVTGASSFGGFNSDDAPLTSRMQLIPHAPTLCGNEVLEPELRNRCGSVRTSLMEEDIPDVIGLIRGNCSVDLALDGCLYSAGKNSVLIHLAFPR